MNIPGLGGNQGWDDDLQQVGRIPRLDRGLRGDELGDAPRAFLRYVDQLPPIEPEPEIGPPQPFNARQPYTVTTAIRKTNWFERSFEFDEKWFRLAYRMSKRVYFGIVQLLEAKPIFLSHGRRPQREVKYQFGVFLLRFGLYGPPTTEPALKTGIGHGTVILYCRRVTCALRELGLEVVAWPDDARKDEIKLALGRRLGINGAIGIVDGSLLPLTHKPSVAGDSYLSRKKTVAVNAQMVVDHTCRIISYDLGWPGSKNDRFIWLNSYLWQHRQQFFTDGEFVLGDKGYPCSRYLLRPYADDELGNDRQRRKAFNRQLSSARVTVERAFGRLKAQFPSLGLMGTTEHIQDLYKSIEAIFTLHNLCIDFHDKVDGLPDAYIQHLREEQNRDDDDKDEEDLTLHERVGYQDMRNFEDGDLADDNEQLLETGRRFRNLCIDILYPPS